jgi:hypothetical protein
MITEDGPFANLFRRKEGKGRKIDDDTKLTIGEDKFYSGDEKVGLLGKLKLNREKRSYVSEMKKMDSKEFLKTQRKEGLNKREQKGFDIAWRYHKRKTDLSFKEKLNRSINQSEWGQKRFRKGKPIDLTSRKNKQELETPWQLYRSEVKKHKKEEIRSQPLFSQERKVERKDFRGQLGYKTTRKNPKGEVDVAHLSHKNILQRGYLLNKHRGGDPTRNRHSPIIPYGALGKEKFSFKGVAENIKFAKEIALGGTDYSGYSPTGAIQTNCMDGICKITKKMTSNLKKAREGDTRYK